MGIEGFDGLEGIIRAVGLHVARVMGVIWFLPVFSHSKAARLHKFGIALTLGLVTAIARGDRLEDPGSDPIILGLATVRELLFGLILGWMASLVFEAARIAGSLIATEMGLNVANQVDPITGLSQPLLSQVFMSIGGILFFAAGGHEMVLSALVSSFDGVPVGTFSLDDAMFEQMLAFTLTMIGAGVKMAAPVFIVLVIVTISVGFLAKVAPQLHILEASWPIRIASGLLLMILFLPQIMQAFDVALDQLGVTLHHMAGGR